MGENRIIGFGKKHGRQLIFLLAALFLFALYSVPSIGLLGAGKRGMAAILAGAVLLAALIACLRLRVPETAVMGGLLLVLSAAYLTAFPPGTMPDEESHFLRAYEVAQGGFISRHMAPDGAGGDTMPKALRHYADPEAVIDPADSEDRRFGNTALYSPVSYLPQALGIRAALLFTRRAQAVFYAGRAANALVSVLLCVLALRLMPFGKEVLFLLLAFPVTGQALGSLSPDGFTIALAALFTAQALRLRFTPARLMPGFAWMGLAGLALSQCKIVYIVLLLLALLVPDGKFASRRQALLRKLGLLFAALALNLAWLAVSAGYLVEFNPGVDSGAQVRYVLSHLPAYALVCLRTIYSDLEIWITSAIAQNMGRLEVSVHPLAALGFYTLLLYALMNSTSGGHRLTLETGIVLLAVFLLGCGLIFTSLYVQWTPLGSKLVHGIQGRYFTPLLPALCSFMLLLRNKKEPKPRAMGAYLCLGALAFNGIALLSVVHFYG